MENTLKPENQRILVCYQIGGEEPIRLWRFEENNKYNPIIEGDLNLDAFLFSFYEHGSLSDDLTDRHCPYPGAKAETIEEIIAIINEKFTRIDTDQIFPYIDRFLKDFY